MSDFDRGSNFEVGIRFRGRILMSRSDFEVRIEVEVGFRGRMVDFGPGRGRGGVGFGRFRTWSRSGWSISGLAMSDLVDFRVGGSRSRSILEDGEVGFRRFRGWRGRVEVDFGGWRGRGGVESESFWRCFGSILGGDAGSRIQDRKLHARLCTLHVAEMRNILK